MNKAFFKILLLIVLSISINISYAQKNKSENIEILTDENFQKEISKGIVIVDFWASWCYPCKIQAKILDEMMPNVPKGVKIAKLDTEQNRHVSSIYGIRSLPTLIVFKDGSVAKRYIGVQKEEELLKTINELKNE